MFSTCRKQCIYHAAVLPSFTDSTVVSEQPARSPPQKTAGFEMLCIVVGLIAGNPERSNLTENIAFLTVIKKSFPMTIFLLNLSIFFSI